MTTIMALARREPAQHVGAITRYSGAEDDGTSDVRLPCDPEWPETGDVAIQALILASDAVSGDGSIVSRPRKRSSPERKPTVPRLTNGALTALAEAAYEAAGLGARREMELVAANQTLQAQAKAVVSAASARAQGVAREAELVVANQTLKARAEAALEKERAQGQARAAEAEARAATALATEKVEAATRVAALHAQATVALAAEKTRAAAEAADLRAANDRLMAQVAAAEKRAEDERDLAQRVAEWKSVAQEAAPPPPEDQTQQLRWLAAQMREMHLANLQMQAQMRAQMDHMAEQQTREMARAAERQARQEEELRKERLQLEDMYRSARDGHARQQAGLQYSGPPAMIACRSVQDEAGSLLVPSGDRRTPSAGRRSDSLGGRPTFGGPAGGRAEGGGHGGGDTPEPSESDWGAAEERAPPPGPRRTRRGASAPERLLGAQGPTLHGLFHGGPPRLRSQVQRIRPRVPTGIGRARVPDCGAAGRDLH